MHKFYLITPHFAERLIERTPNKQTSDMILKKLREVISNKCLQLVFDCHVYGTVGRRLLIDDRYACGYTWDEHQKQIVFTTFYDKVDKCNPNRKWRIDSTK